MIARDFASPGRDIDRGFVARHRARGTPDAAIARMGGWCVSDLQAIPRELDAVERPALVIVPAPPLDAMAIPEIAEILQHVAEQYDVTPEDILGYSHSQEYVPARHEAFAVVYELNRYTLKELGGLFNKTGEAILYGLKRHYERLRTARPERDW